MSPMQARLFSREVVPFYLSLTAEDRKRIA